MVTTMITDLGIAFLCLDTATNSTNRANGDIQIIHNNNEMKNQNTLYNAREQWVGTGHSTKNDFKIP
jgi:hypothetical protein